MTRSPAEVPLTFIRSASEIDSLARLLQGAVAVAIDTETVYKESLADDAGPLRDMSVASLELVAGLYTHIGIGKGTLAAGTIGLHVFPVEIQA